MYLAHKVVMRNKLVNTWEVPRIMACTLVLNKCELLLLLSTPLSVQPSLSASTKLIIYCVNQSSRLVVVGVLE